MEGARSVVSNSLSVHVEQLVNAGAVQGRKIVELEKDKDGLVAAYREAAKRLRRRDIDVKNASAMHKCYKKAWSKCDDENVLLKEEIKKCRKASKSNTAEKGRLWALVKATRLSAARDRRKARRWKERARKSGNAGERLKITVADLNKKVAEAKQEGARNAFEEVKHLLALTLNVVDKSEKELTAKQVTQASLSLVREMQEGGESTMERAEVEEAA